MHVSYAMLNDPIGDLDDLAFSPGSKKSTEDESLLSVNWQSISEWNED
jgi:hypothetical protein